MPQAVMRSAVLALLAACATFGALAACRSAVNLDVTYRDASPTADASDDGGEAGIPPGTQLEGCPCDEAAGFGCCVTSVGPSFCTTDLGQCEAEQGVFMKCFRPDPNTESECCWHGDVVGSSKSQTAYAAYCDGGPPACATDNDCRNFAQTQRTCLVKLCGTAGPQIGVCGAEGGAPPACP
jgi:hypothetical protein